MSMLTQKSFERKGIHNGIIYATNEDGWDFYYSTKSGKTAMSYRGAARMLGCHHNLISRAVEKRRKSSGTLKSGMKLEMLTDAGLRSVTLIFEDELGLILRDISSNKRIKKETVKKAQEVQNKYVQAGMRLQAMLEIAPEVVAMEAISKIEDEATLQWVQQRTEGIIVRKQFTNELKARGVTDGGTYRTNGFAQNTDAINKELFDATASQLRKERGVKNTRDGMSQLELAALKFAELGAIEKIRQEDAHGNYPTAKCSRQAGKSVRNAMDEMTGKKDQFFESD